MFKAQDKSSCSWETLLKSCGSRPDYLGCVSPLGPQHQQNGPAPIHECWTICISEVGLARFIYLEPLDGCRTKLTWATLCGRARKLVGPILEDY